ncbi:hypothetical protein GS399_07215 [Pedobacter sp. HMF7647]|uniref:Outer membrane beta-barrel protein n=1 Tax=Hufsiella arboris TaxID=2695275 RepID=A0A7K1Y9M4_9SPHI|nr:hypothetical protein [Hufsiella arboris]MXV50758.1 hypothetical protein [Hufsiella arboris]
MKKLFTLLFLFLSIYHAKSQIKNDSLEHRIRPDSLRTGELYLDIYNFDYLRNYEFYNKIQDGYTLYGLQLEPQLVYYIHPRLVVMAGANFRKDFGNDQIKTTPLFSIKYQKKDFAFITGALEGTVSHRFIEPLYDVERKITDPVEYGTQFLITKPSLFFDGFIRWKKMIYKPSPEQEQINAGISTDIRLLNSERFRLSLPVQMTVFHQGGQIDTVGKPLQTLFNGAAGFDLKYQTFGFVKNVYTQNYFVYFNELSPTKILPYSTGKGIYLNAGTDTKWGSLIASYWNANGFYSPYGMPIFQSESQQINHPGYSQKNRKLLFFRYAYQQPVVPHFFLDARFETASDLGIEKKTDLYFSLFLVYKQDFRLVRKK